MVIIKNFNKIIKGTNARTQTKVNGQFFKLTKQDFINSKLMIKKIK